MVKICNYCKKKYKTRKGHQKFCSRDCAMPHLRVMRELNAKKCSVCKQVKDVGDFHNRKEGFVGRCKPCDTVYHRKLYNEKRDLVFAAYGGYVCACCGEKEPTFLTIDHVNGGGNKHIKKIGGAGKLYPWLIRHGFPAGFQVLCFNCNHGKHLNGGICPHKKTS